MLCAYCKEDKRATREHIIPKGIIDLFPECNYVYDLKEGRTNAYQSESVIKDVCNICNNECLSDLDSYGLDFIKQYFVKTYDKDDKITVNYKYNLLERWLLKIIYNSERALKKDVSFFESNLEYILGNSKTKIGEISIFGGLFVNTSAMPEFWVGNMQLQILRDPQLIYDSLIIPCDPLGSYYTVNKDCTMYTIDGVQSKHLIRFGSGVFLIILWNKEIINKNIKQQESYIERFYPYKLIGEIGSTTVERCTNAYNIHVLTMIENYIGMAYVDQSNSMMPRNIDPITKQKELSFKWDNYVREKRDEIRVKKLMKKQNRLTKS